MSDSVNENVRCLIIGSDRQGIRQRFMLPVRIYLRCFMKEYSRGDN